jgi:hypothetical protein
MRKASKDMKPEYDFSRGVRGKYAAQFRQVFFSDSGAVNDALRSLVEIAKRSGKTKRRGSEAS